MKVILTTDVDKLGKSGDMKTVADGFATNFLIPRKLAVPAAGAPTAPGSTTIASREDKRPRERADAEIAATRIASTTLTMGVKVGEGGKLYGSITSKEIAEHSAVAGSSSIATRSSSRSRFRSLGTYKSAIKVFSGMSPEVRCRRAQGLTHRPPHRGNLRSGRRGVYCQAHNLTRNRRKRPAPASFRRSAYETVHRMALNRRSPGDVGAGSVAAARQAELGSPLELTRPGSNMGA